MWGQSYYKKEEETISMELEKIGNIFDISTEGTTGLSQDRKIKVL